MVGNTCREVIGESAYEAGISIPQTRFTSPRWGRKERMCIVEKDKENDDEAFIVAMQLALDWRLVITDEEWERYKVLMGREAEG